MRRRTMLLTISALTSLAYCSDNGSVCEGRGFCALDATAETPDVVEEPLLGFADVLGFVAPDAGSDAADAAADASDDAEDAATE